MSNTSPRILIVDDDPSVRKLLVKCFGREGYETLEATNGEQLMQQLEAHHIDLITLDLSLGGEDGLDLARQIRSTSQIPIVMVTGKGELIDTVVGLEVGADDYISKPFELREVTARIKAVLRRFQVADNMDSTTADVESNSVYRFEKWLLDTATRELRTEDGNPVELTSGEFDLLNLFVSSPRQVLSREQIMNSLKGSDWMPNDRTIDNQVARLRKKLSGSETTLIKTVRGTGYLFTGLVSRI